MSVPDHSSSIADASVVVALPCYNEAAAIPTVVAAWRSALPTAEIVVFDNNSTDGTGDLARSLGIRVIPITRQGKGYVVRAIFETFPTADAIILADGDGTYPADRAPELLAPVLSGEADMTVGARRPVADAGAMTLIRSLGNRLIPAAFFLLIGPGNSDLLSGYRVFSKQYRSSVRLRSKGFEIETELASEAVARNLKVVEIPVPYYARIAGTESKLRAFRDGSRILKTIVRQSLRLRPWRLLCYGAFLVGSVGYLLHSTVLMLAGGTLLVVATALAAYDLTPRRG